MGDLIAIARLIAPFGVKGYLKVRLLTHDPERLTRMKTVHVGVSVEDAQQARIDDLAMHHNGYVIKLSAAPDRTAAERIVGCYLFVDSGNAAKPPRGSYFVHDVIGCRVETADGSIIGTVQDVRKFPAQDIWSVECRGKIVMIPAVPEFIRQVDVKKRLVVMQNVEGFLEP